MTYIVKTLITKGNILEAFLKHGLGLADIRLNMVLKEGNLYIEVKCLRNFNDFGKEALNKAISDLRAEGYSVRLIK